MSEINRFNSRNLAISLAERGFGVIPLHSIENGACTCGKAECRSPGKHPRTAHGLKDATVDPAKIQKMFIESRAQNVGVLTGRAGKIFSIDDDPRNNSMEGLLQLGSRFGITLENPHTRTGSGGHHYIFKYPDDRELSCCTEFLPGLDLKANGGYIVAAGSVHLQGNYTELIPLNMATIPEAPPELLNALEVLVAEKKSRRNAGKKAQPGSRNNYLTSEAGRLRRAGHGFDGIMASLIDINLAHCNPPLEETEVANIANSVSRYPTGSSGEEESPYVVSPGQISLYMKGKKGEPPQLTEIANFSAHIEAVEVFDDGVEVRRMLQITGVSKSGKPFPRIRVPASQFTGMGWLLPQWGPGAVIKSGQGKQDHVRAAIQLHSRNITTKYIYGHVGPRRLPDGRWAFLHRDGALTKEGNDKSIAVELPRHLQGYAFPELKLASLKSDFESVIFFLRLAPYRIVIPLIGSLFRAPLGEVVPLDYSLFLVGPTGVFKSELLALLLGFYGSTFSARNLTGGFESTDAAIELSLAMVRGAVIGFDDFVPTGAPNSANSLNQKFERLARSQGNRIGRQRLTPDISFRADLTPGGLPVMTGEDAPHGRSARARTVFIEVEKGDIDVDVLSKAQEFSACGAFNRVMAAYISWLLPQMDTLRPSLMKKGEQARTALSNIKLHRRVIGNGASLEVGFETFLDFVRSFNLMSTEEIEELSFFGGQAIAECISRQSEFLSEESVADRFLSLLGSALISKKSYLSDWKSGGAPRDAGRYGWLQTEDGPYASWTVKGNKIGWINPENGEILLEPNLSYVAVQEVARGLGAPLEFSKYAVWKLLAERGLILRPTSEQKNLIKRTVEGQRIYALVIGVETLAAHLGGHGDEEPL